MASESVKVAARIRPQSAREKLANQSVCTKVSSDSVTINNDKTYGFNYAFDLDTTQSEIYNVCVKDLVAGVFNGLNATILAYGQTGSGKTYTMGTSFEPNAANSESIGIVPRAVEQIFDSIHELKMQAKTAGDFEPRFTIEAQFIELYNEELIDLLTRDRSTVVRIQENPDSGQIIIKNAVSLPLRSYEEVLNALKTGAINRTTGSTNMNENSSRSHAIFSLHIKQEKFESTDNDEKLRAVLTAKLHFVDLAGSERLKRTGATGERAKEGISINGGLLALGNVISALTESKKTHVPYRDSKLTRLLQDSLGGNSHTLMIACASPSSGDTLETLSTLTYASRARGITNRVTVNKDHEAATISQLKSRITSLETELAEYKKGMHEVPQRSTAANSQNNSLDFVEKFSKTCNTVFETFKQRVDEALGNKPQIDSLVESQQDLIAFANAFKENVESHLNVLQIPSRAKTRKDRRDTIFNPSRKVRGQTKVTTLKSMPIILSDDDRTTNMEITPDEDKENESNDATVIAELQREVAMYKERAERAEQESRHNEEKAANTVNHLQQSLSQLKRDATNYIKK